MAISLVSQVGLSQAATQDITISGANTLLVVFCATGQYIFPPATNWFDAVDFNGTDMFEPQLGSTSRRSPVFLLKNPDAGSHTITPSGQANMYWGAICLSGVEQSGTYEEHATGTISNWGADTGQTAETVTTPIYNESSMDYAHAVGDFHLYLLHPQYRELTSNGVQTELMDTSLGYVSYDTWDAGSPRASYTQDGWDGSDWCNAYIIFFRPETYGNGGGEWGDGTYAAQVMIFS